MQAGIEHILAQIHDPEDLRKLDRKELANVAEAVRERIIDVVSTKGGHLGASLGATDLVVALHYFFNTPYDQLIWDVGHQAYAHKILTGRNEQFNTLRQKGGLSGFPKRSESKYDAFGTGHSSTSISAILGMATAAKLQGHEDRKHIAVIGDGGLTAGMAFEGLNHAGASGLDVLIVLNDNRMSIDPNVGALQDYLNNIAQLDQPRNLFEALGFHYEGPIDGNDVEAVLDALEKLQNVNGPKLLHALTIKGKGYKPAEEGDKVKWHAPGLFHKTTGKAEPGTGTSIKFQDVFGETLLAIAEKHNSVVAVTPAMATGSSLVPMMKKFPERVFDVGIAEQHAVTFSAGLAASGLTPFCVIYSTFLQRAYDQAIHDVALQNLPVIFCIDRAGLVGADGATHHGVFDIAFLQPIPNFTIAAPMDEQELTAMMNWAVTWKKSPVAIRYPRGKGFMPSTESNAEPIVPSKGRVLKEGSQIAVVTIGNTGNLALDAIKMLGDSAEAVGLYDMRFAKPLDEELLSQIASRYHTVITVEDGVIKGGFGEAVGACLQSKGYNGKVSHLGVPDQFIEHGTQEELHQYCNFDASNIGKAILSALK